MKTQELYVSVKTASDKFKEALAFPDTEPMRESLIQRFEYTFELAWKLMSSILNDQSINTYGVKNIIREAARLGLIDSPEKWFEFALARNKASHIYKEDVAKETVKTARTGFFEAVNSLLQKADEYSK